MSPELPKKDSPALVPLSEPWVEPSYADAVRDQILSGWIGPGQKTAEFQSAIERLTQVGHCLATTSGTIALSVAAHAVGLRPGDEILVPAYGVISTINAFTSFGLVPRLVDIEDSTGSMSPDHLEATIRKETRAVCFVDFSGYCGSDLRKVSEICQRHELLLIEDAACAFGQNSNGKSAGSVGDAGIFSFSVPKLVSTGQGGAVVTDSQAIRERAAAFIDQGGMNWRETGIVDGIGLNLRFNDVLAALGIAQLADLESRIQRRTDAFESMRSVLGDRLWSFGGNLPPLHFIVFTEKRDELIKELKARKISSVSAYRTIVEHPPYKSLAFGRFEGSEFWRKHAVFLPFGMALDASIAARVAETVTDLDQDLIPAP